MGCWQYCPNPECGLSLPKPTPSEVVVGERECPSCGTTMHPIMNQGDLIIELLERVEELEKRTAHLRDRD